MTVEDSLARPGPAVYEMCVHVTDDDGVRDGGEPWWNEGIRGASVTPTAPWNRADEDIPTLDLMNVPAGAWTLPEARRFALAILAAADYAERPDPHRGELT